MGNGIRRLALGPKESLRENLSDLYADGGPFTVSDGILEIWAGGSVWTETAPPEPGIFPHQNGFGVAGIATVETPSSMFIEMPAKKRSSITGSSCLKSRSGTTACRRGCA